VERYLWAIAPVHPGTYGLDGRQDRIAVQRWNRGRTGEVDLPQMAVAFNQRDDELLGMAEVAAVAGVGVPTARTWCLRGRLPWVPGARPGQRFVRRSDLQSFLAERITSAVGQEPRIAATEAEPAQGHAPDRRSAAEIEPASLSGIRDQLAGGDALRRLAAEVSGQLDLETLFADVVADAMSLFSLARMGLWLYDGSHSHPFSLAAQHGLSQAVIDWVSSLETDSPAIGLVAVRTGTVTTLRDTQVDLVDPKIRQIYAGNDIRSVCFAPIVFRDEPLGLVVLYHDAVHDWTDAETALARGFADQMAAAIGNARLVESVHSLAARLEAVQELSIRLNRTRGIDAIAAVIVEGAARLIDYDSIRVYRVDHATGMCEPIGFRGSFGGSTKPDPAVLRVPIGDGLTGWAAAHNETVIAGDAAADPRALPRFLSTEPESIIVAPISFEDRVHGVIVISASGRDRFGRDDETTLTIFASYAAQAIVNTDHLDQLDRQRRELEHQLASQRRLLEVNERLISTRDP
jgi:GAF domain-containing protein